MAKDGLLSVSHADVCGVDNAACVPMMLLQFYFWLNTYLRVNVIIS